MRSGQFLKQVEGHRAFHPAKLPPDNPPIQFDAELLRLLSNADQSIGRLDGIASRLPNPDIFVGMYVRQEAVLSSQIEGTQSTLEDVLQFEMDEHDEDRPKDVEEVVNYVRAMNYGLARIHDFPLSKRLICEIHEKLMEGVRGGNKEPGQFRRSQNWIGPEGCDLNTATFIPPPVHIMHESLDNLEFYLRDAEELPLILCGLAHAQFETIHPFLDGNGRVGRLLITFLLCQRNVLQRPLLYTSHFLKQHRSEYYDRLTAIRQRGDWEGWLKFFLRGVGTVSQEAAATAGEILDLRERHLALLKQERISTHGFSLLDELYQHPILNVKHVQSKLRIAVATANNLVQKFEYLGLLKETTGHGRNRRFAYTSYLNLFAASTRGLPNPSPGQLTISNVPLIDGHDETENL